MSNFFSINLDLADPNLSVEECWSEVLSCANQAIDQYVPAARPNDRRRPAWADFRCWSAIRAQKNAHRTFRRNRTQPALDNYTMRASVADHEVRRSKRKYFNSLANDINHKPKLFWRFVNDKVRSSRPTVRVRDPAGNITTNPLDTANALNNYFGSVFQLEDTTSLPNPPARTAATLDRVTFSPVVVAKALRSLKRHSCPGQDGIPNLLLAKCSNALALPLSRLFTRSFERHVLPRDWLSAVVKPIFKKGSKLDPANYRPISLVSSGSKAMEVIVRDTVVGFANEHGLFGDNQFGFRSRRSTTLQLIDYLDTVTAYIDNGSEWAVDSVLLDLRKAFDLVPHQRLLIKLAAHGITGDCLEWIRAFLSDRSQCVAIDNCISPSCPVLSGVPQGSVLGPSMFLFYINDLEDDITSHVWKFADDTSLVRGLSPGEFDVDAQCLQLDLNSASDWASTWLMSFGISKCAVLHFGHARPNPGYMLCGQPLVTSTHERYLGLIISDDLKASLHCQELCTRAHALLSVLFRAFGYMDKRPFLLIYRALVRPRLEYACQAWSPHLVRDITLLERVQRRATRMVSGLTGYSYEDRLRYLSLQTLQTRRRRADLILVYQLLHGLVDFDWRHLFTLADNTRTRGHELKLAKFRARLEVRRHSFCYRVVNSWNALPASVVSAPSVNSFKSRLHVSGALGEL